MTKGIICTIDFSESSKDALTWSVTLAKLLKTHLTILYTYRLLNHHNGEIVEFRKKVEENARQKFCAFEKDVLEGSGIKYEFKIEIGFISNRVKDLAKKNGISFVVVGGKMNSTDKESFDELVENIHVPLMIVP